jgi:hypothetical protein
MQAGVYIKPIINRIACHSEKKEELVYYSTIKVEATISRISTYFFNKNDDGIMPGWGTKQNDPTYLPLNPPFIDT